MRFKTQRRSQMPVVNLVPMMDVIMTILTFFIIVSMSLGRLQAVDTVVPPANSDAAQTDLPDPLLVVMNSQQQFLINNTVVSEAAVQQQLLIYLKQNPQGGAIFLPAPEIPYEIVVQTLGELQAVAGARISLGVE